MNARERAVQQWFRPWKKRGYTMEWASSGHRAVYDPAGALVTVMSSTPSNPKAALERTERILRRNETEARRG